MKRDSGEIILYQVIIPTLISRSWILRYGPWDFEILGAVVLIQKDPPTSSVETVDRFICILSFAYYILPKYMLGMIDCCKQLLLFFTFQILYEVHSFCRINMKRLT